jgi:small subunit ribosomal protein S8
MTNDPIADMLTQIRNALLLNRDAVEVTDSKQKREIARILKESGYLADFYQVDANQFKNLKLVLKYQSGKRVIQGLKRVSRPGRRVYVKKDQIPKVIGGMGVAIISTSKGIVTGHQAKRHNLGGEVLCLVW